MIEVTVGQAADAGPPVAGLNAFLKFSVASSAVAFLKEARFQSRGVNWEAADPPQRVAPPFPGIAAAPAAKPPAVAIPLTLKS